MPTNARGNAAILILLISITILAFSASFFYTNFFQRNKKIAENIESNEEILELEKELKNSEELNNETQN